MIYYNILSCIIIYNSILQYTISWSHISIGAIASYTSNIPRNHIRNWSDPEKLGPPTSARLEVWAPNSGPRPLSSLLRWAVEPAPLDCAWYIRVSKNQGIQVTLSLGLHRFLLRASQDTEGRTGTRSWWRRCPRPARRRSWATTSRLSRAAQDVVGITCELLIFVGSLRVVTCCYVGTYVGRCWCRRVFIQPENELLNIPKTHATPNPCC